MMEDITPRLIDKISEDFNNRIALSPIIRSLNKRVNKGNATYKDAQRYAREVGNIRAKVLKNQINSDVLPDGRMYYNIAKDVFNTSLKADYKRIQPICNVAQNNKNKMLKIGLQSVVETIDQDNIDNIVNMVDATEHYDDKSQLIEMACATFAKHVVDRNIQKNCETQQKLGLRLVIVRTSSGKTCPWCDERVGTFTLGDAPDDIWGRHNDCNCSIDYERK